MTVMAEAFKEAGYDGAEARLYAAAANALRGAKMNEIAALRGLSAIVRKDEELLRAALKPILDRVSRDMRGEVDDARVRFKCESHAGVGPASSSPSRGRYSI